MPGALPPSETVRSVCWALVVPSQVTENLAVSGQPAPISATVRDSANRALGGKSIVFVVSGGGQTIATRHLDIQQCYVWLRPRCQGEYVICAVGLGHDFDISFHRQQCLERSSNHSLVFRDEHADHAGTRSAEALACARGKVTLSRKPSCGRGSAVSVPPRSKTRSRSPRSPVPVSSVPPRPSSTTSTVARPSWLAIRIAQRLAWLCRITFVTPSRTVQARTDSTTEGSDAWSWSMWSSMPAAARAS